MDEQSVAKKVLQFMMDKSRQVNARRIRVINLALYDNRINPDTFSITFKSLALGTPVENAHLHVRVCGAERLQLVSNDVPADPVRVDSVEVD